MTPKQRDEMLERKRASYRRRLQAIRDKYGLPALSNRQRERLLDLCVGITGDGLDDVDLRVLHRLATRGLVGDN